MKTNCLYYKKLVIIKTELNQIPTLKDNNDYSAVDQFYEICKKDSQNEHFAYGLQAHSTLRSDFSEGETFYKRMMLIHSQYSFETTIYRILYVHKKYDKYVIYAYHDAVTGIHNSGYANIYTYLCDQDPIYIKQSNQDFAVSDIVFNNSDIYIPNDENFISSINNYINRYEQVRDFIDDNGKHKQFVKPIEIRTYLSSKYLQDKINRLLDIGIGNEFVSAFCKYYETCSANYEIAYRSILIKQYCNSRNMKVKDLENILQLPHSAYNSRIRKNNIETIENICKILKLNEQEKLNLYYSFGLFPKKENVNLKDIIKQYLIENNKVTNNETGALRISELYCKAGFYPGYIDKNQLKPSRDLILAISLGLHLSTAQTENILNQFGYGGLHKIVQGNTKDWIVKFCLDNKQYNIQLVTFLLNEFGYKPLKATHI